MARSPISSGLAASAFAALLVLAPAPLLAQTHTVQEGDKRAPAEGSKAAPAEDISAELMYRLLVGDIALQRGDPALAARAYFEAARDVKDARLARRATEIALAARQRTLAIDAATLWSQLDPRAERPKQVIAGLSAGAGASGELRGSDLKGELERALAEAATAGARLGEAFLQLNRALASEPDKVATFKLVQSLAQPYPNSAEAQFAVALAAYNAGLPDFGMATAAMQAVDRALGLKPGWEQAMLLKVEILGKQSPERAAEYLAEVLRTDPDSKVANSALAQVRIQQKRYAEAMSILQRLWEKDPGNHEYQFGMAMLAVQMKDWAKAERLFEELEPRRIRRGRRRRNLPRADRRGDRPLSSSRWSASAPFPTASAAGSRSCGRRQCWASSDASTRRADTSPICRRSRRNSVSRCSRRTRKCCAMPVTTRRRTRCSSGALVEFPDDPDLLYDIAMVAEKLDKIDVVESRLTRLIELKPDNAHALNALGYTLVDRTPRVAEGLALIERALVLAPDDPFILDSVGWAHFRMGQLDDAEKHLRRAMDAAAGSGDRRAPGRGALGEG